jgi:hypothetical protein
MYRVCDPRWVFVLMLAGCSGSHEPAKREVPAPEPSSPSAAATPAGPASAEPAPASDPHQGLAGLAPAVNAADLGPDVEVGAVRLKAPEGWARKQPRSEFVAAEFALPKAEGDELDGRLTISTAGGSVEDNVKRWRDQFGGKPEKDSQQELEVAGMKVTVVDFIGTYNDQPGPFAPGVQRAGYRMLAAIVPAGGQSHFIKAYGPQKTMGDHEDAFHAFLQSMQKK